MNFVKKWMNCIISFIAGVCGLALSACPGMLIRVSSSNPAISEGLKAVGMESYSVKAFKILTDADLYTEAKSLELGSEFMRMKVFAIITLVISILLIIYALVMLLKNLNAIKVESKIFDIAGIALIALLLVATIGLFIASNNYANGVEDIANKSLSAFLGESASLASYKVKVGVYQPTMLVIAIISLVVTSVFTFIGKKKAA